MCESIYPPSRLSPFSLFFPPCLLFQAHAGWRPDASFGPPLLSVVPLVVEWTADGRWCEQVERLLSFELCFAENEAMCYENQARVCTTLQGIRTPYE